ncbi:hypothetical protein HHI36_004454 [Cryptolaemus montrouzieri]|uniref:Uncharacterized protein n=1 Tax=Cryptolaemus montrouzieri TaxID=559131 RepID=A0ABD2NSU7_9CUCU
MKDLVFALCQSWNALSSTITSSWKNLWPDVIATPTNDPQISVSSEVIEQIAAETQIIPEYLETCYTTMNQEDGDEEIPTAPQVKAQDAINAFEVGLQWTEEDVASYNELLLLRRLRGKARTSRFNNVKHRN